MSSPGREASGRAVGDRPLGWSDRQAALKDLIIMCCGICLGGRWKEEIPYGTVTVRTSALVSANSGADLSGSRLAVRSCKFTVPILASIRQSYFNDTVAVS